MRAASCQHRSMKSVLLLVLLFSSAAVTFGQDADAKAQQLAKDVWKASGGQSWSNAKRLRFTFVVEQDGNRLASAEHDWDVLAGTDHVKWKDKDVTVTLAAPAEDEASEGAYARWTNDSYWLLAPLKVLDPGVKLAYEGAKEMDGVSCETLRMSFEQVGLTPGDQYILYVDPQTKLVRSWDYSSGAEPMMHGTWEKYQTFGGLQLAMEHNFDGKMIRFENVEVIAGQ